MSDVTIRPMTKDDLPLMVDWLKQPHVKKWFHKHEATSEAVAAKYGPRIDGKSHTRMFVSSVGDTAIGMIQAYKTEDYPEYAQAIQIPHSVGVDLFIGDPTRLGQGLGAQILERFSTDTIPKEFPDAAAVVASPSVNNPGSIQAFEQAGFTRGGVVELPSEPAPEQVMVRNIL